jgi:hypothetical protein
MTEHVSLPDTLLFPSDPVDERKVDPEFAREWRWLQSSGIHRALVDHDRLTSARDAVFRFLPAPGGSVLYRGWMMNPEAYRALEAALAARNLQLITASSQYQNAHQITGWLKLFEPYTPKTVILGPSPHLEEIHDAARHIGSTSFIVKDFVKSRKHEWNSACFSEDAEALPAIVRRFIELQGEFLAGGIVVREFVPLDKTRAEQRVWWRDGKPVLTTRHPDSMNEEDVKGEEFVSYLQQLAPSVQKLGNPFVTTDIAWTALGTPVMIELGDGQVSGLPNSLTEEEYMTLFSGT